MAIKKSAILFIVIAIFLVVIFFLSIGEKNIDIGYINEGIIQIQGFYVETKSTEMNTFAKGTIFVKEVDGVVKHVQIVSLIEVDSNDWGGVAFYIPRNWHVSKVTSSYPKTQDKSSIRKNVATWTTGDSDKEWRGWVEVGRNRDYRSTGGGTGIVVICLDLDENVNEPIDTFNFCVEVGSEQKDETKVLGTDHITFKIPCQ
ncbi:hypothetical protein [Wukongibacter sp. M2B1]|uniref:hypothetical protein n=1 Tax=Wukongibacter sp. M2B1 TaxID=3088895 RepID=UPI003D7B3A29